jgi:uncharacterized membrane protein YgcG
MSSCPTGETRVANPARKRRTHGIAILATLAAWLVATPLYAQKSLAIESFAARIVVGRDGLVDVTETIQARFTGAWNGLYRTIPVEYRTPQGFNYTLRLAVMGITDDAGQTLRYESSRERHYLKLKVWIPDARDAVRTIVVRYRVNNALKFFEEHDELYWNVTGDEWDVPIGHATAVVELPDGVENVRTRTFTGGYGSREDAARVDGPAGAVHVETMRPLGFREGLTVAVAWNPGVVHRPTRAEIVSGFLRANLLLLTPLLVVPVMWRWWSVRGRDPRRRPIAVRYEPPPAFTPGEVGTLVDDSPDLRDVTATLVDLAVRGFVRIDEEDEPWLFGLFSSKDYRFVMRRPRRDWTPMLPHERRVLEGIFTGTEDLDEEGRGTPPSVKLSALQNRFYRALPAIKGALLNRLVTTGVYSVRPDRTRHWYVGVGVVLGALLAWGGVVVAVNFGQSPIAAVVGGVLSGAAVCAFGWIMPARTAKGARLLEDALGFEEFLRRVESDRFDRVVKTPELFEKYLPFAMALGVETHWARAFEGVYSTPPTWYQGGSTPHFSTVGFVGRLGGMAATTGHAMTSAPRSSGGSGFGGGGSSGGGFGGGGGGGF